MSDDNQGQFTLTIGFDARTGQIHIDGPLDQQVLCYGMLERARDLVHAHTLKKKAMEHQGGIARPSVVLPPEFRRR